MGLSMSTPHQKERERERRGGGGGGVRMWLTPVIHTKCTALTFCEWHFRSSCKSDAAKQMKSISTDASC